MRSIRRIFVITCLTVITALIWAGIYARKQGFTNSWRNAVEAELNSQGWYVDIGKLTLGAFRGLVAEDVKIFRDARRKEQFAEINDVYLDVGLGQVWRKKLSINTMDIQNGKMTIPLDPENPVDGGSLQVTKLSGRITLTESLIEFARVEANLAGVAISIKGSMRRPQDQKDSQIETTGKKALESAVVKIQSLKRFIDTLELFEFPDGAPSIKIDFRGDLGNLNKTTARVLVKSKRFRKKGSSYDVLSFHAEADYDGRIKQIKIPRFELQDPYGLLDADATWNLDSDEIDFDLNSNADLISLLEFFFPNRKWKEIVFYQPPGVEAEGTIKLALAGEKQSGLYFPGQIIGNFKTERFVSSGIIFNSSSGDFSLKERSFYVRNVRADHKTGVAFLNCKYEPGKGRDSFQFQSAVKMDPRVFAPFLKNEDTRRFLRKWEFSDSSGVHVAASGQSTSINFEDMQAKGVIDLRDFTLNGIPFLELETDFEVDGHERWYRNVSLKRDQGKITANLAYTNTENRIWEIKGGISTVRIQEGFGAFSPVLQKMLAPYRFTSPPTIKFQGKVDGRNSEDRAGKESFNDLEIAFSGTGAVNYQWNGRDLPLDSPEGTLSLKKKAAHLRSFKAGLCGGTIEMEVKTPDFLANRIEFDGNIAASEIGLRSLGKIYDFENEAIGHLEGDIRFAGKTSRPDALTGQGQVSVSDRDLFQIPALSGLEALLISNEQSYYRGNNSTKRSLAKFEIADGILSTTGLDLVPGTAGLTGSAVIDLSEKSFEAELSPAARSSSPRVYRGKGDLDKPAWEVITGRRFTTLSNR